MSKPVSELVRTGYSNESNTIRHATIVSVLEHRPVIIALWEAEEGRSQAQGLPGYSMSSKLAYLKITVERAGT